MATPTASHGPVPDGLECLVTMEDIDETNYVEYECQPSGVWKAALMEESVVVQLLQTQFSEYIQRVKQTDCQAELRRLLDSGPPIFISDPHGFPMNEGDTHISKLWFASDNTERSAVLEGSVQGPERDELWKELKQFIIVEGKEQEDE